MPDLKPEIDFYEKQEAYFLKAHKMEWVLISELKIIGIFGTFDQAAEKLTEEYDPNNSDRPFLLRQVGAPQPTFNRMVPVSV